MKFRPVLLAPAAISLLVASASAQPNAITPLPPPPLAQSLTQFTSDPVWQKKFVGDWVPRSAVEPRISTEEQQILTNIQPLLASNNIAAARQALEQALRAKPEPDQNAALQFTVGNLYFAEDQLEQAVVWYQRAAAKFPDYLRVHKQLGFVSIRRGENHLDDAIKHFTKAIQLGEGDGRVYGLLAYAYQQKGLPLAAEAAYRRAMVDDGLTKDWKLGLASVLFTQGRYLEASAIYGELINQEPDNSVFWQAQANCYVALENYGEAVTSFEIARRLGGIRSDALVLLGNLYIQRGLPNIAAGVFLDAVRSSSETIHIQSAIQSAQTLTNYGSYAESIELVQAIRRSYANRLDPPSEMALLTLEASNFTAQGQPDRAAQILTQVIERDPLNGPALIQLAIFHQGQGDSERARLYLERAVTVEDVSTKLRALKSLGQLLVRQRKFPEALSFLNQAIALQPDDLPLRNFISQVEAARRQFDASR